VAASISPQTESVIEAGRKPALSDMIRHYRGGDVLVERVIVDSSSGQVHADPGRARWGAMYRPWIRKQLLAALPQVARQRS
jgi:hypothetical protein